MTSVATTLRPGEQLQLLLKDLAKAGSLPIRQIGVYRDSPVEHPEHCQHPHTICQHCLPNWEADYVVRRFAHGTATGYRTVGCRCPTCLAVGRRP
jgi:hypothetical protein